MKKIFFSLSFIFFLFLSQMSSAQNWFWGRAPIAVSNNQTGGFAEGWDVAVDKLGNAYLNGVTNFAALIFDGDTLYSDSSATKAVLAKYDSSGAFVWARTNSSANGSQDTRIETDLKGNIYMAGSFLPPSISFDTITISNSTTGGPNDRELFIIKYKNDGSISWAKNIGGQGCTIDDIKTDIECNIYLTGYFLNNFVSFDTTVLTNHGYYDIFILKLDSSGNFLWAKSFGGTDLEAEAHIAVGKHGGFYLTATYYSASVSGAISISNPGNKNVLIAKFKNTGSLVWVKSSDSYTNIISKGIVTDNSGRVFITGNFTAGDIYFGNYLISDYNVTSNVYLVAYDTLGNVVWTKNGENVQAYCLAINTHNNLFLSGSVSGTQMIFGNYQIPWTPTVGGDYMFVIKFSPAGNAFCGGILSSGGDDINAIAVNDMGQVYVGGDYLVNPFVVGNDTLPTITGEQLFIARYSTCLDADNVKEIKTNSLLLYPNPATNEIKISNLSSEENQISIYNLLGARVANFLKVGNSTNATINISDLPSGIYFIHLTHQDGSVMVKKFICARD